MPQIAAPILPHSAFVRSLRTPNVLITVAPVAFTYSPAKDGLRSDIKSLTRLATLYDILFAPNRKTADAVLAAI